MEFYFIRHGQSENNRLWATSGSYEGRHEDPPLTDVGREQARRLAEFLRQPGLAHSGELPDIHNVSGFDLTHLYCSLMIRAVETGMAVSEALGLPLVAWEDAHEVGGIHQVDPSSGERQGLPGRNRVYFEEHFPDLVLPDSLAEGGWWDRPCESREQALGRARRFVRDLLTRHGEDDRVAVISHGDFYNCVLSAIFDLPTDDKAWFSLNNVGLTRINFEGDSVWLAYANRVDFLPPELITPEG